MATMNQEKADKKGRGQKHLMREKKEEGPGVAKVGGKAQQPKARGKQKTTSDKKVEASDKRPSRPSKLDEGGEAARPVPVKDEGEEGVKSKPMGHEASREIKVLSMNIRGRSGSAGRVTKEHIIETETTEAESEGAIAVSAKPSGKGILPSYQPPPASDCGTIKVLSCNINGKGGKGMSGIRNVVVPKIVEIIDPDVLLLQEKKMSHMVNKKGVVESFTNRKYISVESAKDGESRVIYDSEKYQLIPEEKKVFGGKCLEEVFDESIQVFPSRDGSTTRSATQMQAETGRIPHPLEEVVKGRTSYICLETKGSDPVRRIVYMSYHNMYTGKREGGAAESRMAAIGFCKMMKNMQQLTGVTVVAGADLNRTMEDEKTYQEIPENKREATKAEVMEVLVPYALARRTEKIDYIMASPTKDCVSNVRALVISPLSQTITNLTNETPTTVTYPEALDHDPIVCDIVLPTPSPPPWHISTTAQTTKAISKSRTSANPSPRQPRPHKE